MVAERMIMNDITITIEGNLGTEPTFYDTEGKTPFAKFRVGTTAYRAGEEHTQWFTVKTFSDLARNCAATLAKGMPVVVRGRLETHTYESADSAGEMKSDQVIVANALGVSLARGTVSYEKNPAPAA